MEIFLVSSLGLETTEDGAIEIELVDIQDIYEEISANEDAQVAWYTSKEIRSLLEYSGIEIPASVSTS